MSRFQTNQSIRLSRWIQRFGPSQSYNFNCWVLSNRLLLWSWNEHDTPAPLEAPLISGLLPVYVFLTQGESCLRSAAMFVKSSGSPLTPCPQRSKLRSPLTPSSPCGPRPPRSFSEFPGPEDCSHLTSDARNTIKQVLEPGGVCVFLSIVFVLLGRTWSVPSNQVTGGRSESFTWPPSTPS